MEIIMPTWLFIAIGIMVFLGLLAAKRRWQELDSLLWDNDKTTFMFNMFLNAFILYLAIVWPVTLSLIVLGLIFYGLGSLLYHFRR